jgi:Fe-Mn family superoxide dismutase
MFSLPELPYSISALAPHVSAETLEFHHGKHHRTYVDNLNKLVGGKPEASQSLEDLIRSAEIGTPLFNNAAQAWNHAFYWNSMRAPRAEGAGSPGGALLEAVQRDFGSVDKLRAELAAAATGHFGSGWAWLVQSEGKLAVRATHDADLPLKHGQSALLTIDVWEHAYYVDYRNARAKYVEAFLGHLVNWQFAEDNLAKAKR